MKMSYILNVTVSVPTDDTLSKAGTDAVPSQMFYNFEPLEKEPGRYAEIFDSYKDSRTAGLLYWYDDKKQYPPTDACRQAFQGFYTQQGEATCKAYRMFCKKRQPQAGCQNKVLMHSYNPQKMKHGKRENIRSFFYFFYVKF